MADLTRIWTSLSKPPGLENSQITDFFDFEFTALPHKLLQPDKFLGETQELRKRFREGAAPEMEMELSKNNVLDGSNGGIFLPAYHRRIPSDGFPMYAESVWEQIVTNKDLDLPSQQELLAQFRCDEIAATATNNFNEIVAPFEANAQSGKVLDGLGPITKQALTEALESFEEAGGRYFKPVFERKRDDLRKSLENRLRSLFVGQFGALSKRAVAEFTDDVTKTLKKANSSSAAYDFAKIVEESKEVAITRFTESADECFIPGPTTAWSNHAEELKLLQADIDEIASRLRGEEMKLLITRLEKDIRIKLAEPIELEFQTIDKTLWDRIWATWQGIVSDAVTNFETKSAAFNATDNERTNGVWDIKKRGWAMLNRRIDEEVMDGNLLLKLREKYPPPPPHPSFPH